MSTDTLARRLGPDAAAGPITRTGVEHEFQVRTAGRPVDFRDLIGRLDVDGVRIVASDPLALRCRGGGLLTADGPEAEVATSPVPVGPGFAVELDRLARIGHGRLASAIGESGSLTGWSTHLNVEVKDEVALATARLMAKRFAPAVMLLVDRADSPGLLVRPRPGRLELGGEYVAGDQLRAAAVLATGAALACEAVARGVRPRRSLPPALRCSVEPARARFGWYVDRCAFGPDLYRDGRSARLRRASGRTMTADEHLGACWEVAEEALAGRVSAAERDLVHQVVAGVRPIPLEVPDPGGPLAQGRPPVDVLDLVVRPGFTVQPVLASWDWVIYAVDGDRRVYVLIPSALTPRFHERVRHGELDDLLTAETARPSADRVLASIPPEAEPGVYDRLGNLDRLGPRERDPITGRVGGGGGQARRDKQRQADRPDPPRPRFPRPVLVGAAAVTVAAAVAVGAIVASGDDDPAAAPQATIGAPTTAASTSGSTGATLPDAPDGEFRPDAAQLPTVQPTGTFDVVRTVTASDNATAPVGTVERRQWRLSGSCEEDGCTWSVGSVNPAGGAGAPATFDLTAADGRVSGRYEFEADCFDPATGAAAPGKGQGFYEYDLRVEQAVGEDGVAAPVRIVGTALLSGVPSAECPTVSPVTYSVVATRAP